MLKFTKYGRAPSTGSFARKEKPAVVLTAFTDTTKAAAVPEATQQEVCSLKPKPVSRGSLSVNEPSTVSQPLSDSTAYLVRSRVSMKELMRLDLEDGTSKSTVQQTEMQSFQRKPPIVVKSHTLDDIKIDKKRCRKPTSNSFRSSRDLKLPVYNDGYFPKVRPLNKLLTMKRADSDSGLLGKQLQVNNK